MPGARVNLEWDEDRSAYLIDNFAAVLSHSFHDGEGSILTRDTRRCRCDGKGIDQGLRVVFTDINEQVINISANIGAGRLNASYDLRPPISITMLKG